MVILYIFGLLLQIIHATSVDFDEKLLNLQENLLSFPFDALTDESGVIQHNIKGHIKSKMQNNDIISKASPLGLVLGLIVFTII